MRTALAALAGVTALALMSCASEKEQYCQEVTAQQEGLTEVMNSGEQDLLIQALPAFEDLRAKALGDIRDEWDTVVTTIEELRDALAAAGVDPATYDAEEPPEGVSQEDRDRIAAAATELSSPQMLAAFEGVQQQAKDVCGTQLFL